MDYKTILNDKQFEAVSTTSQYTRIVAGAGSGKTRVLTYRISYLIEKMDVDPYSIVAIAFTNKVADEMRTRALSILHGMGGGITVSTFHSFCAKFLRKEIDVIGYPNNFTIMDEEDSDTLVKNIAVDNGLKKNDELVKYTIGFISYHKCNGHYPSDVVLDDFASEKEKKALKFFHEYELRKEKMLSLDFDDLLLRTIQILDEHNEIRTKWQNRITNILIDEFQDTNDIQFKLVRLLMNDQTNLYVVGDPDQTIYTWRGANQQIILDFNKTFPAAETIILNRNYRSTKVILDAANKLISFNKKRVPKDLYTEEEIGVPIETNSSYKYDEEAKYVADQIEQIVRTQNASYSDIAILYRASYLTLPFEKEFMRRQIPYRIYGGLKFFQRKEIKDLLAYFRLFYNTKDDLSFERIVNVPRRGIGDSSLDILKSEKTIANLSYFDYLANIQNYSSELKPKHVVALTFLIDKIQATKARLKENLEAYPQILEDFISDIGYYEYLQSDDEGEERLENVKTLISDITDFLKKNPESSFEDYLENATLQTSQDEMKDVDSVKMMTIHVAKGLEFNYVFVVSMVEGVFPSNKTMDENGHDGEEEERRLCYVAFTRAKKKLYATTSLSYSHVLDGYGVQSRFFKEAGLDLKRNSYFQRQENTRREYSFFDEIIPDTAYIEEDRPTTNDVTDWQIGDHVNHEVFGHGIVTGITDETILVINFDNHGTKSILATHPKLRKESRGFEA